MTTPFAYQDEAEKTIERMGGRCLLALEQGLGKSLVSLLHVTRRNLFPAVVVCPASLKWNWEHEAHLHCGLRSQVLEGTRPPRNFHASARLLIVNYDILGQRQGSNTGTGWLPVLQALQPKAVILDECSALQTSTSKRSRWVRQLCHGVDHILALSGTPLLSRPAELWTVLNLLRPLEFKSRFAFLQRYCNARRTPWGWDFSGASHLDELHCRMQPFTIRKRKAEVLPDLPPKIRGVTPLSLPDEAMRQYREASADLIGWLRANDPVAVGGAARAEALVRVGYLKRLAATGKLPVVFDWLDNWLQESDGKIILAAVHRKVIQALQERYADSCVVVDGSVTGRDRQRAVDAFQGNSRIRVFIGNIKAAGMGLTLTAASDVAFVELGWTPGEHVQMEDRCILHGTPVLTPDGWRPIQEIQIGDKVITHTGNARKVLNAWSAGCKKRVIAEVCVTGWPEPLQTTHDHRFMLASGEWKQACDLRPGDWLAMPGNDVTEELVSLAFDAERVKDTFAGRWNPEHKNGRLRHAAETIAVTDDFLFTIGYYAGDGSARTRGGAGRYVSISGNTTKKQPAMARCRAWLVSQGLSENEQVRENGVERRYYSAEWAFWFKKHCGVGAYKKRLPSFVLSLNPRQSRLVLDGLRASDGYVRAGGDRTEYVTMSYTLAAHVMLLAKRAGFRPALTIGSTKQYVVGWGGPSGPRSAGRVSSILLRHSRKADDKPERIYDLTVEQDESFVIGHAVVHNCHRVGTKGTVFVHYLVGRGTVEEHLCKILQTKQSTLSSVLDGAPLDDDLSIHDELIRILEAENATTPARTAIES